MEIMKNGVQPVKIITNQGAPKTPFLILPKGLDISIFILKIYSYGTRTIISIIMGPSEEDKAYSWAKVCHSFQE
jgi:hypothetical protein